MGKLLGDPPRVEGIIEFEATSTAEVAEVRIHRRVTSRRQLKITLMPMPALFAEITGAEFSSMVHINPLELGRCAETWREPVPGGPR